MVQNHHHSSQASSLHLASWNVNSIRARQEVVQDWLRSQELTNIHNRSTTLLLMQETKVDNALFPLGVFERCAVWHHGQPRYNGVATVMLPETGHRGNNQYYQPKVRSQSLMPDDPQARYQELEMGRLLIVNVYVPNGNPIQEQAKLAYKLNWLKALINRVKTLLSEERPLVILGDFNICPRDLDCYDPKRFVDDALTLPEVRDLYFELTALGLIDSYRAYYRDYPGYTYWDYMAGALVKDNGLRIDQILCNAIAMDYLQAIDVDKKPRLSEKPSDHTPIVASFDSNVVTEGLDAAWSS